MTAPLVLQLFDDDNPLNTADVNANMRKLAAMINSLSGTPVVRFSPAPGDTTSGAVPVTGGSFMGGISAPSILIGPVGGQQYAPVTTNDKASQTKEGIVNQAADNNDAVNSAVTVDSPNATDLQTALDLINEMKGDITQLAVDVNAVVTLFNSLQANLRTAGVLDAAP